MICYPIPAAGLGRAAPRRQLLSLLPRLLLLVAAALLPALLIQVHAERDAQAARERLVHEQALRFARLLAAELRTDGTVLESTVIEPVVLLEEPGTGAQGSSKLGAGTAG